MYLSFSQTEELKQLRDKILFIFEKNEEDASLFDNIINTAVLAKSMSELEDLNASLKF